MTKSILIILMSVLALADVGKIVLVKGDAVIQRDSQVIKANNNLGLLKKDIAETAQGRMQMIFNDNTVISLGRDSRFVIKEYLYVENSQNVAATFKIEKGFVKTITGAIGKIMPALFTMETSTTKITPHGTIWSVSVDDESEVYKVFEGRITLAFHYGVDKKVELNAGESANLKKSVDGIVTDFTKSKLSQHHIRSKYENRLETNEAIVRESQDINYGSIINSFGAIVDDGSGVYDDGNNGHGNDPGGVDFGHPGLGG